MFAKQLNKLILERFNAFSSHFPLFKIITQIIEFKKGNELSWVELCVNSLLRVSMFDASAFKGKKIVYIFFVVLHLNTYESLNNNAKGKRIFFFLQSLRRWTRPSRPSLLNGKHKMNLQHQKKTENLCISAFHEIKHFWIRLPSKNHQHSEIVFLWCVGKGWKWMLCDKLWSIENFFSFSIYTKSAHYEFFCFSSFFFELWVWPRRFPSLSTAYHI